jgi:hypothetical protein
MFDKWSFSYELSRATGVSEQVLITGDLGQASVAEKMSWAANRQTTRIEDRAYSVMGLFGIHMPMLYGEGENAFRRLQEEIIRTTPDDSIFAWRSREGSISSYCGLLARSPDEYLGSERVTRGHGTFATSNMGLRIETWTKRIQKSAASTPSSEDKDVFACRLDATDGGCRISLLIRRLDTMRYARVRANCFTAEENTDSVYETLYVEHTPQIPRLFKSNVMHCFHFKWSYGHTTMSWRFHSIRPCNLWDPLRSELSIPQKPEWSLEEKNVSSPVEDFAVAIGNHQFVGIVWLSPANSSPQQSFSNSLVPILLGYDRLGGRVWCKILRPNLRSGDWPQPDAPTRESQRAITEADLLKDTGAKDRASLAGLIGIDMGQFRVAISPGLRRGLISHIVTIDGLVNPQFEMISRSPG